MKVPSYYIFRFGEIVREEGKRRHDKSFTDQILSFDGKGIRKKKLPLSGHF